MSTAVKGLSYYYLIKNSVSCRYFDQNTPYSFTTSKLPFLSLFFTIHPGDKYNFQPSPEKVVSSSLIGAATRRELPSLDTRTPFSASSFPQTPEARKGPKYIVPIPSSETAPRVS